MKMNKKGGTLVAILLILIVVCSIGTAAYVVVKLSGSGGGGGTTIVLPGEDYPPAGMKLKTKSIYGSILTDSIEWALFDKSITNYAQAYRDQDYLLCCASGTADTPAATGLVTVGTWGEFKAAAVDLGVYGENRTYTLWAKRDASYEAEVQDWVIDWEKYDQDTNYQIITITRDTLGTVEISTAANTTNSTTDCTTTCKTKSDVKGKVIMIITGTVASYDDFKINGSSYTWTFDGTNYYHIHSYMPSVVVWEFGNTLTGGAMDVDVKFYREDEYGRCDGNNHDSTVIQTIDCIVT